MLSEQKYTKRYFTEKEAASYLCVNQQTIARLRKNGFIKAVKLNRSWIYRVEDIDHFFNAYVNCDLSGNTRIKRRNQ